jgi:hypothetical protein
LSFTAAHSLPRFFPYFKAVVRFCRENEGEEMIGTALENATEMQTTEVHREAFRIAGREKNYCRALDLAVSEEPITA